MDILNTQFSYGTHASIMFESNTLFYDRRYGIWNIVNSKSMRMYFGRTIIP